MKISQLLLMLVVAFVISFTINAFVSAMGYHNGVLHFALGGTIGFFVALFWIKMGWLDSGR